VPRNRALTLKGNKKFYQIKLDWLKKINVRQISGREDAIPHLVSFSVVNWIDALSRVDYKDIFLNSLQPH
jgi:hypothetical protein